MLKRNRRNKRKSAYFIQMFLLILGMLLLSPTSTCMEQNQVLSISHIREKQVRMCRYILWELSLFFTRWRML